MRIGKEKKTTEGISNKRQTDSKRTLDNPKKLRAPSAPGPSFTGQPLDTFLASRNSNTIGNQLFPGSPLFNANTDLGSFPNMNIQDFSRIAAASSTLARHSNEAVWGQFNSLQQHLELQQRQQQSQQQQLQQNLQDQLHARDFLWNESKVESPCDELSSSVPVAATLTDVFHDSVARRKDSSEDDEAIQSHHSHF